MHKLVADWEWEDKIILLHLHWIWKWVSVCVRGAREVNGCWCYTIDWVEWQKCGMPLFNLKPFHSKCDMLMPLTCEKIRIYMCMWCVPVGVLYLCIYKSHNTRIEYATVIKSVTTTSFTTMCRQTEPRFTVQNQSWTLPYTTQ